MEQIAIPFDNFKRQYASIRWEIENAVSRVLESGRFVLGHELESFEREFGRYIGRQYAVGTASGTDAIALSLMALGIGRGDEVITSAMTAFPTIAGILKAGATPVAVDISPLDGLLDVSLVEEHINAATKAILPVHLYGQSCDMDVLNAIVRKFGLKIIEDCAQSAGATYKQQKTGCLGDAAAFSFYPTKNLGAYGDGGMVMTDNRNVYEKLLRLRNYGKKDRDRFEEFGFNSRLDEIQAAVLRVKLRYLDKWNAERQEIASYFSLHLDSVSCLQVRDYGIPVFHLFVVRAPWRDGLMAYLGEMGIQTFVHYPLPVHKQRAYPLPARNLPQSDCFAGQILSIPLYPELREKERRAIVAAINSFKG